MLVFLLVVACVNGGITWYFYNISISNHKLIKQDRRFHAAGNDIDVLVMGHSRPGAAINDAIMESWANFCSGGESNIHTYYKLKYILESSGKNVKKVILPAGYGTFALPDVDVNSNSFYWKRYVDYLELGREVGDFESYLSVWIKSRIVPWYEYPYLRMQFAFGDFDLSINKEAYDSGSDTYRLAVASRIVDQQSASKALYHPVSINYIRKTIDLCEAHNVELIYVKFPVSSYYTNATNFVIDQFEMQEHLEAVDSIITNSGNVKLLDLREWPLFNSDSNFSDPQHIDKNRRDIFTTNFATLIE